MEIFKIGSNCESPDLCLLSSWDCRHGPLAPQHPTYFLTHHYYNLLVLGVNAAADRIDQELPRVLIKEDALILNSIIILNFGSGESKKNTGLVAHTYNPSTQEVEAGGS
jgi:hypothetical protein